MTDAAKLLIVEDEMVVQMHLRSIVSGLGHTVVGVAATPEIAIAAAEAMPPDLVLMDIRLAHGGDGVETARALRERFECAVIFLTAHSDEKTIARTGSVAAAGYLVKPFTGASVSAAISTALASHAVLKRARKSEDALTSILGGSSESVLVVDRNNYVRFASPRVSSLTRVSSLDICDHDLFDVMHFEGGELAEALNDAFENTAPGSAPGLRLRSHDGSDIVVDARLEPVPERDQTTACLVLTLTERGGAPAPHEDERPLQMLVYSHDTLGMGHLRRCLNVIRAVTEHIPGLSTLLVTGSPVAHRFELPIGTDYLKLPAVRKVAPGAYESRSLSISNRAIRSLRSNLLLRTVRDFRPDILLVDHSPLGMNGELKATLEWLRANSECSCFLGLREVIDDPETVVAHWEDKGVNEVLERAYDHVAVYGAKKVYDTAVEYRFSPEVRAKTTYMHHVTDGTTANPSAERDPGLVVLAIGGGDGGADTVIKPFLQMLAASPELDVRVEILLGPLLAPDKVSELQGLANGLPAVLRSFVANPKELYARAQVVIATAGYNTSGEILAHADRAILIPRVMHRQEQLIRARRLEELGLVTCIHPKDVTPERLREELASALENEQAPLAEGRLQGTVPLDGAQRFAAFMAEKVAGEQSVLADEELGSCS